jgi:exopolysaccharide biosynthesis polyprenyl glycosylphosphotransferase
MLLVAYFALYFYMQRYQLPRLMALYVLWEGLLLVFTWRLVCAWFFSQDAFTRRVLIVGAGDAAVTAFRLLRDADFRSSTVVGLFDAQNRHPDPDLEGLPIVRAPASLTDCARAFDVNEIVLADTGSHASLFAALVDCQEQGIDVVTLPHAYEDMLHRVPVQHLESSWLFTSFVESIHSRDSSLLAKRAVDILGAVVGLFALAVLTPFVALAIRFDSRGSIFYRQVRTGRAGREFVMWKFRTMVPDAELGTGPQWSVAGDRRVTRVGRLLRQLRLDELPNLVNVLRGDMSLVGPRPERPELVRLLSLEIPFYKTRQLLRPGVTGWAQVNQPYGDSVAGAIAKLEYDLYYLKHRSMMLDLRILLRTIGSVLRFEGR